MAEREYICFECGAAFEFCRTCDVLLPHACGQSWGEYCFECAPDDRFGGEESTLKPLPYPGERA